MGHNTVNIGKAVVKTYAITSSEDIAKSVQDYLIYKGVNCSFQRFQLLCCFVSLKVGVELPTTKFMGECYLGWVQPDATENKQAKRDMHHKRVG